MLAGKNNVAHWVCAVVAGVGLLAGGCSSSSGGVILASSYSRTRGHLAASQSQIDHTLSTLNGIRITDPTNLKNAFNQYKQAVDGL